MPDETQTDRRRPFPPNPPPSAPPVTTGAGIAIAGVWFACTALTIFLLLIFFVLGDPQEKKEAFKDVEGWAILLTFLIPFIPMFVAYNTTQVILRK